MTRSIELPGRIADWIAGTDHDRPFFRDPDFINAFGRPGPAMLRAAVDELWKRADIAAYSASHPISLPARLSGKSKALGSFITFDEAAAARKAAQADLGYGESHGKPRKHGNCFVKKADRLPLQSDS